MSKDKDQFDNALNHLDFAVSHAGYFGSDNKISINREFEIRKNTKSADRTHVQRFLAACKVLGFHTSVVIKPMKKGKVDSVYKVMISTYDLLEEAKKTDAKAEPKSKAKAKAKAKSEPKAKKKHVNGETEVEAGDIPVKGKKAESGMVTFDIPNTPKKKEKANYSVPESHFKGLSNDALRMKLTKMGFTDTTRFNKLEGKDQTKALRKACSFFASVRNQLGLGNAGIIDSKGKTVGKMDTRLRNSGMTATDAWFGDKGFHEKTAAANIREKDFLDLLISNWLPTTDTTRTDNRGQLFFDMSVPSEIMRHKLARDLILVSTSVMYDLVKHLESIKAIPKAKVTSSGAGQPVKEDYVMHIVGYYIYSDIYRYKAKSYSQAKITEAITAIKAGVFEFISLTQKKTGERLIPKKKDLKDFLK